MTRGHSAPLPRAWRGIRRLYALARQLQHPADLLLLAEAISIQHRLPAWLAQPLPLLMRAITPPLGTPLPLAELERRTRLIDAAVSLDRLAPLGPCLRRSLVRYVLLRRAGLPVEIVFGARPEERGTTSLIGHAWIELDGGPWMEAPEHLTGYSVMYRYPEAGQREVPPEPHTEKIAENSSG